MAYQLDESPAAVGRRWAEEKAERLRGIIPAIDWPEEWSRAFDGTFSLPEDVSEVDGTAYRETAHYAAAKRWLELVEQQSDLESLVAEEAEDAVVAVQLLQSVLSQLPRALKAEREGPRVFIQDEDGAEVDVTTLTQAWRVVADWDERLTR